MENKLIYLQLTAGEKVLKSEFLSSRKPFKVNKSKSLKLGRQSRYFFVGRFVFRPSLNWPCEDITS